MYKIVKDLKLHCLQWPKLVLIRIHFNAQLARASLTLGACVFEGIEGGEGVGVTVLSMGVGMCLRVTLLRIKMKSDYLPSSV